VTDVGGNRAVVGELAHRLVPAEDASALAAAWHNALTDAAARHQDGERARRRVLEHFSVAEMVRRYEAIYSRPPARSANS
jgi:glycosyltransferase involved in cell wall biosynthesis